MDPGGGTEAVDLAGDAVGAGGVPEGEGLVEERPEEDEADRDAADGPGVAGDGALAELGRRSRRRRRWRRGAAGRSWSWGCGSGERCGHGVLLCGPGGPGHCIVSAAGRVSRAEGPAMRRRGSRPDDVPRPCQAGGPCDGAVHEPQTTHRRPLAHIAGDAEDLEKLGARSGHLLGPAPRSLGRTVRSESPRILPAGGPGELHRRSRPDSIVFRSGAGSEARRRPARPGQLCRSTRSIRSTTPAGACSWRARPAGSTWNRTPSTVDTWAPGDRPYVIRLTPTGITGRRIRAPPGRHRRPRVPLIMESRPQRPRGPRPSRMPTPPVPADPRAGSRFTSGALPDVLPVDFHCSTANGSSCAPDGADASTPRSDDAVVAFEVDDIDLAEHRRAGASPSRAWPPRSSTRRLDAGADARPADSLVVPAGTVPHRHLDRGAHRPPTHRPGRDSSRPSRSSARGHCQLRCPRRARERAGRSTRRGGRHEPPCS